MAITTAVKFFKVASLPSTLETGAIYFVTGSTSISGGTGTATAGGDIYVATSASAAIKYTSDVQSVSFEDATAGSPYTGGALTVTDKYGISKTYNVASQEDLSALAAAMSAAIAGLDATGYAQATVEAGSGASANSAVVTIRGIKEEDGIISADSNNDTAVTIAGGNNITVDVSGNTITIAGENGGVQSIQAGTGIAVDNTVEANPTVGIDSTYVDGELSTSNKLATEETVTTAIEALDGTATIASKSGNAVTIKTGITETGGVVSNDSGTDITLADVASTGAAADVSIADTDGKYTATTVEGALAELVNVAHSGAAADVSIADSGSKFTATNVEDALAELKNDIAAINQFEYVVESDRSIIQTAPTEANMYKIYLLPQVGSPSTPNVYDEYIAVDHVSGSPRYSWELFGTTQVDISNKADKVSSATSGNFAGLDANGNLTDSGSKASDFKTVQTAVTDPTASGTSITFIDSISQDTNGVITPTKKTVQAASSSQAGLMSSAHYDKLEGIAAGAQVNTLEGVQVSGTDLTLDANKKVNIVTMTAYDATDNPIATKSDIEAAQLSWQEFN